MRFSLKYILFGGIAGLMIGYNVGLGSYGWYFAPDGALFIYLVGGTIFTALLYNGLMMVEGYSNKVRYAATGGLIGTVLACTGGFIYVKSLDLSIISFQDVLVFVWALLHCGISIGII